MQIKEPTAKTQAVRSYDGESGGYLSLVDTTKKKWVGGYAFGDDGTISFNER